MEPMTAISHTLLRKLAIGDAVSANKDCHQGRRRRAAHVEVTPVDVIYY